jgi:two-component system nitrate/nitrite response regulator NarL
MPAARVCFCHRSRLFSECLAATLSNFDDFDCQVVNPEEVLAASPTAFGSVAADVCLLDASLEGDLMQRVAERLREQYPACKVVLLIAEHSIDRMFQLAQLTSHGCFFEGAGLSELCMAIQTVLDGEGYCSPQLANALLAQVGRIHHSQEWPAEMKRAALSSREQEILELIAHQQLGNKQIARELNISLYTVKNHVHNIIEKLGVEDRHDAVLFARRRGLLSNDRPRLREVAAVRLQQ